MIDSDIVQIYPSEEIFEKAKEVFQSYLEQLSKIFPYADIEHVGSTSIKGALGKFDIDIQIRVDENDFEKVILTMKENHTQKHNDIWNDEFAIFCDKENDIIDYMVTVKDSIYDDFYRVRDFLSDNIDVLNEYNDLKKEYEGKTYGEYREAKMKFFGGNGKVKFLAEGYRAKRV